MDAKNKNINIYEKLQATLHLQHLELTYRKIEK